MLQQLLAHLDKDVQELFDWVQLPSELDQACRYAMAAGGKRLRPLLVAATFADVAGCNQTMMRRACLAVELLHGYSLIHDDLPCMDDDDLRRGKPTCHKVFGENVALLAGDALQSLAFEALTMPLPHLDCDTAVAAQLLAVFAPRARRMVAGQMLDVLGEGKNLDQTQLQAIHKDKTGALIEASVLMGAVAGGARGDDCLVLCQFACAFGLAFQVQDDVLDVIGDTKTLGKPTGSDDKLNKATYVKLLGVDNAKAYADELFAKSKQTLADFGKEGHLLTIINEIQNRQK